MSDSPSLRKQPLWGGSRGACLAALALLNVLPTYAAGDAARGRALAETCVPCHGNAGVSASPAFPILAGQQYDYLISAMNAYLGGSRQDSIMGGAIRNLSAAQIEDLAAYYASLSGLRPAAGSPAAAPSSGSVPSAALAAAQAAADAARSLVPPPPRAAQRGRDPDARERAACAVVTRRAIGLLPNADRDGDGVTDLDDAAPDDARAFAVDADGDGYLAVCNAGQLRAVGRGGTTWLRQRFELVADLDMSGSALEPIGNCGPANNCMLARDQFGYAAHFDGNGHVLRGVRIVRAEGGGVGLFGTLAREGAVTRVVLREAQVQGANGVGLLVGASFGVVAACDAQGRVTGRVAVGGLVGGNAGRIIDSRADVQVEAMAAAGGLAGDMNGTVEHSSARVSLKAGKGVGGLVGLSTYGRVLESAAFGEVAGVDNVGGLVGVNTDALLEASEARVTVLASGTNVGGAVGYSAQSLLRDVVARGAVRGRSAVGGLVGRNSGAVLQAFSTGKVEGESAVGGLIGDNMGGTVRGALFDRDTAGVATGAGHARSTAEMQAMTATEVAWDDANRSCRASMEMRTSSVWIFAPSRDYPRIGCLPRGVAP